MLKRRNARSPLAATMAELQAALAEGWTIDPPVSRRQVPDRPDGAWYCDVILWREGRVRVLTVSDDAALRECLAEHSAHIEGE